MISNKFNQFPTKKFNFRHATNKVVAGAVIKGAGYLFNNQGLKDIGAGVIGKGLLTGGAAHFFGK